MADKAISDLTQALQVTGDDLFVLEQGGEAKKLKGSQVVQYAKDSVAAEVQGVKEYADSAKASADAAAASATKAAGAAQSIDDKVAAADASAKAAASSAAAAAASATGVDEKVQAAQTAADNAAKSETAAKDAQTGAANAQKAAESAQTGAQAAKTAAESAQEAAENAKDAAAGSSTAAEQKATQAAQSAEDAASAKSAAETAKTDAQAARDAIVNMIVEAVTLETGTPATVTKSLVDNVYKLAFGLPRGDTGAPGPKGAPGNGISGIALKSGTHAPGTSDVYTITLTDSTTFDFEVYNGANGQGAGDMLASVYDPRGKRTDVYKYVDDGLAEKQGVDDEIQAMRLRGGINSIINNKSAVSINPAINAAGYLRHNGGNVQIFYDGYLMPFSDGDIDKLFDGKSSTYINFGTGPSNANRADVCRWNETTRYPQNARVTYQTASGDFRWYKALKESQGVTPEGDSTGTWKDISTKRSASMMDVRNLEISIVIDSPFSLMWENGASFYWRSDGQNCSYYKIEAYDSVADQYVLVAERDNIPNQEVVNTQYMGVQVSGTGKRFRITFRSQPTQDAGWFAATQIAFTGIRGGIEGTLLNRGGGTMYGNLSPYTTGGASLGTSSALWQEVRAKNLYGSVSDTTSSFSTASGRSNIASGEKLSTLFGKIAKWFADLKSLAFKDKVSKFDLDSDVQSMLSAGEAKMRKVTLTVAGWNANTKQQTVTVSGILSDRTKQKVICSPVDERYDSAWNTCYVQCVGHAADSLTFQCDEIPTAAVEVFVSIQSVSFAS